jgi:hypothetical protein
MKQRSKEEALKEWAEVVTESEVGSLKQIQ